MIAGIWQWLSKLWQREEDSPDGEDALADPPPVESIPEPPKGSIPAPPPLPEMDAATSAAVDQQMARNEEFIRSAPASIGAEAREEMWPGQQPPEETPTKDWAEIPELTPADVDMGQFGPDWEGPDPSEVDKAIASEEVVTPLPQYNHPPDWADKPQVAQAATDMGEFGQPWEGPGDQQVDPPYPEEPRPATADLPAQQFEGLGEVKPPAQPAQREAEQQLGGVQDAEEAQPPPTAAQVDRMQSKVEDMDRRGDDVVAILKDIHTTLEELSKRQGVGTYQ